ncbi:MAG: metal-independent alpha-mannosidase [Chloroflexi bacterium]|nr:metal-independent alpha-mannosidase [Chloroflexota bacterium]MDL1883180.1 metal-independent alpha-mannosidase [Anaerolineae bacterium CFX8]
MTKPADFGANGLTGSLDEAGRLIALNAYHPQHGYITLTAADPFPETERYNPAAVRAYRAGLAELRGFGLQFDQTPIERETSLLESAIPQTRLVFTGGAADVTTFADDQGAAQIWNWRGLQPRWAGRLSLQRCAYTQLTEGGPLPMPPLELRLSFADDVVIFENPALGAAAALCGPKTGGQTAAESRLPVEIALPVVGAGRAVLAYGFGQTADEAASRARRLHNHAERCLQETLSAWRDRWRGIPDDPLARRGLAYGLAMAVPVGETTCLLTDHMLLPLSWNRDAYYVARALLAWGMRDVVRRHLLWMFEAAERPGGVWGRCYLANGQVKDAAFQLDQQLFPLLELAEYTLETGDRDTLARLQPFIPPLIENLRARAANGLPLFPTDETPADDPIALPYHLSSHILFWRALELLNKLVGGWEDLAAELRQAINHFFVAERDGQRLYAYATDGAGQFHFYHDANDLPLALAPAWGFVPADDPVWRATVAFAFSAANVGGFYGGRLGSVHTRAPWPLGDVQDLIIARALGDSGRQMRARDRLRAAAAWDGALPEAADAETGAVVSRHWFAWPNAALACVDLGVFGV